MASSRSRIAEVLSHLTHSLVLIEDLFQTLVELLNDSPAEHRPLGLSQLRHCLSQCLAVDPELTPGLSLEVTPPATDTRHPFRYESSLDERQPPTRRRHGDSVPAAQIGQSGALTVALFERADQYVGARVGINVGARSHHAE